jgi:hypothetical protein
MRTVWQEHPDDPDVGVFFAEAMMDLRPWDQWTPRRPATTRHRRDHRDARCRVEA